MFAGDHAHFNIFGRNNLRLLQPLAHAVADKEVTDKILQYNKKFSRCTCEKLKFHTAYLQLLYGNAIIDRNDLGSGEAAREHRGQQ